MTCAALVRTSQYAEVMRDSLATDEDGVGGSEECAAAVESGVRGQPLCGVGT